MPRGKKELAIPYATSVEVEVRRRTTPSACRLPHGSTNVYREIHTVLGGIPHSSVLSHLTSM